MEASFRALQHKRSFSLHAEREFHCAIHYDRQTRSANNVEGKKGFKMKLWSMETAKLSMKTILDNRHRFCELTETRLWDSGDCKYTPLYKRAGRARFEILISDFKAAKTFSSLELTRSLKKLSFFVLSPRRGYEIRDFCHPELLSRELIVIINFWQ